MPIHFPRPVPSSINYNLDEVLPGFLDRLEEALMPPDRTPELTMARYQPENYPAGQNAAANDQAIVGLIRSGLLKRFESSVHAFARTTAKMVREHDLFLRRLDEGKVIRKQLMRKLSAADDDDEIEELLEETGNTEAASGYNKKLLRADVKADRDLLDEMCRTVQAVRPDEDPKLAALVEELAGIAADAKKEGIDEVDCRRKRKVLVFSYYQDTIDWMEAFLLGKCETDARLAIYRGRMASVAGNESRHGVSRDAAVHGFAPESAGAGEDPDRFDLLLCTDVLAEGMNLQECRNIINFDLPWNPMPGAAPRPHRPHWQSAPHRLSAAFFPDQHSIGCSIWKCAVRRKLAQAAASVGVEATPIERGARASCPFPKRARRSRIFTTAIQGCSRRAARPGRPRAARSIVRTCARVWNAGATRCVSCPGRPAPDWRRPAARPLLLPRSASARLCASSTSTPPMRSSASWERACG